MPLIKELIIPNHSCGPDTITPDHILSKDRQRPTVVKQTEYELVY